MDLAEYYQEVTKTAGLTSAIDNEDEKVAAVIAVSEQFDIDGIEFENEDEKIAAAVAIIEGFDDVMEKEAGLKDLAVKFKDKVISGARYVRDKAVAMKDKAKEHLKEHKGKYIAGGAAGAAGLGAGYAAGRRK